MSSSSLIQAAVIAVGVAALVAAPAAAVTASVNDIATLNYALTLENLEYTFYTKYQQQFSALDFAAAGLIPSIYGYFNQIQTEETSHVALLKQTITTLGGVPVVACNNYSFGNITTVAQYVSLALTLENTGVSAYTGAINALTNYNLIQAAADIATIEARHAALLNVLNGAQPFPAAADTPFTPQTVVGAITPILAACTNSNVAPAVLPAVRTGNSDYVAQSAGSIANDLNVLQYALTAEHLTAAFYAAYVPAYTSAQFIAAGYPNTTYSFFQSIASGELGMESAVTAAIKSVGGSPVPPCTYNFAPSTTTVQQFVATAALVEAASLSAYLGAVTGLNNVDLLKAAATITTVEARHASFTQQLNNSAPFPSAYDTPLTPTAIATAIAPFINVCPYNLNAAVLAVQAPYSAAASTTAFSMAAVLAAIAAPVIALMM